MRRFILALFVLLGHITQTSFGDELTTSTKKTVCLNMIVKNEHHVIKRCLESVLPIIDTWVIVDTGSEDGTQKIIQDFFKEKGISGKLYERPWVNFAYNRNEALALAKDQADYLLFMDADDYLSYNGSFRLPELNKDFYAILSETPLDSFWVHRLVKTDLPWFWEGIIHELLQCQITTEGETLEGVIYSAIEGGGARSLDPHKHQKDIQTLLQAIKEEPNNSRHYFFLARTYMNIGSIEEALKYFKIREQMEGNSEELFLTKLWIGELLARSNSPFKNIEKTLLEAYRLRPHRLEPLYYLVNCLRKEDQYQKGYELASIALKLPLETNDYYCLERQVYSFGMLFEYAKCATHTKHFKEAIEACQKLLQIPDLPADTRKDVQELLETSIKDNVNDIKENVLSLFSASSAPIHLIYLGENFDTCWEKDWICEILSGVSSQIVIVNDPDYKNFLDRSIIFSSAPNKEKYKEYFEIYAKKGLQFGVIHTSDEEYKHPTDFYQHAKFVIRNYWHKNLVNSKTLFLPLGYKLKFWNGFTSSIKEAKDRKYKWSFAGQIKKSTRISMIQAMLKIPNYYVYEIADFAAPNSLSSQDYRDLLLDSIFVPCPRGFWNLDSFRVCEALECGCIPIVEKKPFDYFSKLFGPYPFLSIDSWEEIPETINNLLSQPQELEKLRKKCHQWWISHKKILQQQTCDLIESKLQ